MTPAPSSVVTAVAPWADRRRRAGDLRDRYPFAAEVLTLYMALLDSQKAIFEEACARPPARSELAAYVAAAALPRIVAATLAAGPARLAQEVTERMNTPGLEDMIERWLRDDEVRPVERYLAGAAGSPILEASSGLMAPPAPAAGGRRCPACDALPQLSYFALSSEALVTGSRYLLCARCLGSWAYPRMTCAACGEAEPSKLTIFSDPDQFPHLRVDGCRACQTYLVTVDLPKDAGAIPLVDELAAIPLCLYAADQGMTKVMPNLMGM